MALTTWRMRVCAAGTKAIVRNAAVGGILLAMIEGVGILVQKTLAQQQMGASRALWVSFWASVAVPHV